MARTAIPVGLLAFFLLPGLGLAGPAQPDAKLVQRLMSQSGMEQQLEQVPALLAVGLDQAMTRQSRKESEVAPFKRSMALAFAPQGLKASFRTTLQSRLTAPEITAALAWFESPLGRKIAALDQAASTPQAALEMRSWTAGPDAVRSETLRRLDLAVRATESTLDLVLNMQVAMAVVLATTLDPAAQPSIKDITARARQTSQQREPEIRKQVKTQLSFSYRSLSEAELGQYLAFAGSPTGKRYHEASAAALTVAMVAASEQLAATLGKEMQVRRK